MGPHFVPNQVMGRLKTIGCAAVEITQKCNLDCTLCYLSEHSQKVHDIPLEEVYRRLDMVVDHYGTGVPVQITGGDPTLRKHGELRDIVAYASHIGLHPALFTNGIGASRSLLQRLAEAGLREVAFHVDTTQKRKNATTESSLDPLREEYIARASGLDLTVVFNTTVHKGNFEEIPSLVRFFVGHADQVGLVSFQLQAETGRGAWGSRAPLITRQSVKQQINRGVGLALPWDILQIGHHDCHSYVPTLVASNQVIPVLTDQSFFERVISEFANINWDRHSSRATVVFKALLEVFKRPQYWGLLAGQGAVYARLLVPPFLRAYGRVHKLSFFVQNFMDAEHLVDDRVKACSFMVMTPSGPMSMCEHNKERDRHILTPFDVTTADGSVVHYEPLERSRIAKVDRSNRIPMTQIS